jgi:hypothetical protein
MVLQIKTSEFFRNVIRRDVIFEAVAFPSSKFTQLLGAFSRRLTYSSVPKADALEGIIARDDIDMFRSIYYQGSIDEMFDGGFHCFRECSVTLCISWGRSIFRISLIRMLRSGQ